MAEKINRKDFLKNVGLVGLGTVASLAGCKPEGKAETNQNKPAMTKVPKRNLGKTGLKIASLSHGIMYNLVENQAVLHRGLQWGIDCWDTSHGYAGGQSELGIGKFLQKYPEKRSELVIVSKASRATTIKEVEERLQLSLKRMNTSYIDIYYGVHALSDPALLNDDLRKWAESAKKRKLIRYFGFSTHKNMAACLNRAAELDWVDAILTSYNFRLMQEKPMQDAVEACHKKGIGLIAMKLMALQVQTDGDQKLVREFLKNGYTDGQAKIKAVLADERISSVCVSMPSTALIATNAAAVLDRKLSAAEMDTLKQYAMQTCSGYCAGCSSFCENAMPEMPYISDIMRFLMYYNNYGEEQKARTLFAELPYEVRSRLSSLDFSLAEKSCPQKLPIGHLMQEALVKLA